MFTTLTLENWRNFLRVDGLTLQRRVFLVGPNASGKSNFLDVFRFLRDIADPESGLQRATQARGGVSQIGSLHARQRSNVVIEVSALTASGSRWRYRLAFNQDKRQRAVVREEVVVHDDEELVKRPKTEDGDDPERLTQTHLEQVSENRRFRELADFFAKVQYLHVVPQLIRDPERSVGGKAGSRHDPYGGDFLEQMARTPKKTQRSRLRKIERALRIAVPQLRDLTLDSDARGVPHLRALYEHWRPNAGWQNEDQFSDGTLRLIGLLWVFLDNGAPLLLEEPELSLHAAVVRQIPRMMARLGRQSGRQVIVSTHSAELLEDEGIAPEEVLLLEATTEDTKVRRAADVEQIRALLEGGVPMHEAVLPLTAPAKADQLTLFGD